MLTPLLVSSSYSFHFGTMPPRALARRARELGYPALALSDRNGVWGLPSFIEACEEEGLRPLLGAELVYEGGRALLLARTREGFSRLSRLLTARAAQGRGAGPTGGRPRDASEAAWLRGALAEEAPGLALATDDPELLSRARGRGELYALLAPGNRGAWRGLARAGLPLLASGEVRFLAAEERRLQRLLLAIGSGRTVPEVGEEELSPASALLLPPEEAARAYADFPEALAANEALAASAELSSLFSGWVFPSYPAPGPGGPGALLRRLVLEGARRRYGEPSERVLARIDHELGVIGEKGFSDYFLAVRDIALRASRTCGRGSAAASVVSYCLGITDVEPISHDLYFERFLNPGRVDPPDIDVDFAWDERDGLLDAVVADYGEARAARVANHVSFQARSALREAARAYGLPEGEIGAVERALAADRDRALAAADPEWREILELAPRLVGLPRHLGVHSGGLILAPGELSGLAPLERSGSGIRVTAWDKEGVEAAGLVKIDLLGNRSLAVVRDALANLRENGTPLDEEAWRPLEDEATVELLARGDTMGVFYVESPAMRLLQLKTGRGDFEHLVIHSSIIRPAANRYINEYVDRLKGKPYEPLHPLLGELLSETYGIMCYQEDVSKAAVALAGFTPAEADGIRKILSKKDVRLRLEAYRAKFEEGARERGVDAAAIAEVWAMIESFAGYSFVKAHSASYAMLSFRSAYLRRHHPAEFMAAVISNRGGFYGVLAYASEARRMGLSLLPPDLNASELRSRGRGRELRLGLGMVQGLGEAFAARLLAERRRGGPFASASDFGRRLRPGRAEAEALVGAGALDSLLPGRSRAEALMELFSLAARGEEEALRGRELFAEEGPRGGGGEGRAAARRRPESPRKRLEAELRYLGTTLALHPLALWPRALARPRALGSQLPGLVGRRVELLGWPITAKPVLTAKEEAMEFVSFEDETALYETVLFPEAYRRFRHLLFEEGPLLVRGLVEEDRGAVTLTVEDLEKLPPEA